MRTENVTTLWKRHFLVHGRLPFDEMVQSDCVEEDEAECVYFGVWNGVQQNILLDAEQACCQTQSSYRTSH